MNKKTSAFRNHLYDKFYQYVLAHDYYNAYLQTEEGQFHDPHEFYASEIPNLLRSLTDNYELDAHYRQVIGDLPVEERPVVQQFMAWFNMHQRDGFREIFGAMEYDQGYDLSSIIEMMELTKTRQFQQQGQIAQTGDDALSTIFRIIDRFTSAAASVLTRRVNKKTLQLLDEYDMQDILLVMLRAQFHSVKTEQVTEGPGDRQFLKIDFLIPDAKIALECKYFDGGYIKKLTDQLDVDIQSYHRHPDCRYLIFFIYDRGLLIPDPNGLERRYEQKQMFGDKEMYIFLKVRPKN